MGLTLEINVKFLPLEINVQSSRIPKQSMLRLDEYHHSMLDELDELNEDRLMALDQI